MLTFASTAPRVSCQPSLSVLITRDSCPLRPHCHGVCSGAHNMAILGSFGLSYQFTAQRTSDRNKAVYFMGEKELWQHVMDCNQTRCFPRTCPCLHTKQVIKWGLHNNHFLFTNMQIDALFRKLPGWQVLAQTINYITVQLFTQTTAAKKMGRGTDQRQ